MPLIISQRLFRLSPAILQPLNTMVLIGLLLTDSSNLRALPASGTPGILRAPARVQQGLHFIRLSDQVELYGHNSNTLLNPASVTKLITAAAILHYFGPAHRFTTRILHTGTKKNGIISEDLIIDGDGDPMFVSETLWKLATDLRHSGIREIRGNLLICNSLFGGRIRDEIRLGGLKASNNAYDAPVTAFGVNFNTIALNVAPAQEPGLPALVGTDPYPIRGIQITNQVTTVGNNQNTRLLATRVSQPDGGSRLLIRGSIRLHDTLKKIYRSVNNPVLSSGEIVRAFLKENHIKIKGKVSEASSVLENARFLTSIPSETTGSIIKSMNLYSNNYISDVLIKRLGAEYANKKKAALNSGTNENNKPEPGTYKNGMDAVEDFLKNTVGIRKPFQLENGSGLTTRNRLSAGQVTRLLSYLAKRWDIFPEFIASLPQSGITGSLESRFDSKATSPLKGLIRAKTGTLSQPYLVSSLAGYLQHEQHGLLAFCIIQNGKEDEKKLGMPDLHKSQELGLLKISQSLQNPNSN